MRGLLVLLVVLQQSIYIPSAAHRHRTLVMDASRGKIQDITYLPSKHASRCDPSGLLHHHRHRKTFVEDTQLALALGGIGRVGEDTTIEKGTMHISDHGAHISSSVGLRAVQSKFINSLLDLRVPGEVVSLIDAVNSLALGGERHVHSSENKLTDTGVKGVSLHAMPVGDHQLGSGAVAAVASANHLSAWPEDIVDRGRALRLLLPHREDGAGGYVAVYIGGAVEGIEGHAELA